MQYGGPGRGFVGPEAYTVYGAPFKKIQSYDYKIRYESEYRWPEKIVPFSKKKRINK